jgi:FolB domain-containing protein
MATDTIFIDGLGLSAIVGWDRWDRRQAQPIVISIHLHLTPDGFLSRAGKSDSIKDTVDYESLAKAVTRYVEEQENGFDDVRDLIDGVVERAFEVAGENGKEVRVLVELPKFVPLAEGGIAVEVNAIKGTQNTAEKKVYVKDIILSLDIGVSGLKGRRKQRLPVNLEVFEKKNVGIDTYKRMVRKLSEVSPAGSGWIRNSHCLIF